MSTDHAAQPTLPAGLPDDWRLDYDLPCPQCRYNLRTLHTPRCPECGLVFRWQAILRVACPRCDEALSNCGSAQCPRCGLALKWGRLLSEVNPAGLRLFEFTDKPIRLALRTWLATLKPARFWRDYQLEMPPVVSRLIRLRRAAFVLGVISLLASFPTMQFSQAVDHAVLEAIVAVTAMLALPVTTAVALPRFGPTLGRFRIRSDQLLRVSAYASAVLVWNGVILAISAVVMVVVNTYWPAAPWFGFMQPRIWFDLTIFIDAVVGDFQRMVWLGAPTVVFNTVLGTLLVSVNLFWWWRFLYVALRRYIRLDGKNAAALLVSTQAIGLTVLLLILVIWMNTLADSGFLHWFGEYVR